MPTMKRSTRQLLSLQKGTVKGSMESSSILPFALGMGASLQFCNTEPFNFFIVPITIKLLIPSSTISKVDDFKLLPVCLRVDPGKHQFDTIQRCEKKTSMI